MERIAQVLVGSQVREVLDRGLDRVPTYGKLAERADRPGEGSLLNVLADAGLIERRGIEGGRPGAFVLALTARGREVAMGAASCPDLVAARSRPRPRAPRQASRPGHVRTPTSAQPNPALLARLRSWRTEEARRKGMPPYVIFHDRTLTALAAAQPRDREALRQVRGIGPAKLEAYAEALLRLLA